MDPAGAGALIGVSIMAFGTIVCLIRERCVQKKKITERSRLVEAKPLSSPLVVEKVLTKKQSSMRDFFKQNKASSELRTIRIS